MRNDARQLSQKQEELAKKLDELADTRRKTLSDSDERKELANQLARQKGGVTNLFNEMRRVSEQSEPAEPLLSKQLYDTLRQSNQDEMNKSLELSAELVQRGFLSQAGPFEERAQRRIDELKRGVEKAAESVLGDDTEALRLAKRELETLSRQLEGEMTQAGTNAISSNNVASAGGVARQHDSSDSPDQTNRQPALASSDKRDPSNEQSASRDQAAQNGSAQNAQARSSDSSSGANTASSGQQPRASAPQAQGASQGSQSQSGASGQQAAEEGQTSRSGLASNSSRNQSGQRRGGGGGARRNFYEGGDVEGGAEGGGFNGGSFGPLTGDNFVDWSDRLRDVEEMLDEPELRTEVARVRDRARAVRLEYKREGKKPDWAVVRLQISGPLVEVRDRVSEELARRESNQAVVPIDRDPVPRQFSELVRRYYEQLGKSE
ncbi:MAG: hypothetical protein DME19_11500 [Verrucomicrobia bacterium]|nr:MAG: hypothetical protein DME19_11500 [Verrucomicrobiota bacterium]